MKLVNRIAQGGFGNVDLVEDASGNRFARKTFARNQALDEDLLTNVLKRFSKEVRIQGGISHPNIVPILGSDLSVNPPWYLMPVAVSSLSTDLERDRTLGGAPISAISDIVAGLEELHAMQIYHRDLKPDNVLRFTSPHAVGGESYYAISDFGLISMPESRLSVLTRTGLKRGSDHYTAPEVVKDLRQASAQSDIFSLGCILHDMVGTEERVPCNEIREPGEFSAILLGCTRRDPSQRFKSVRAVLDAILSVDYSSAAPLTHESGTIVATLEGAVPPEPEFWGQVADFLDYNASEPERAAICLKLGQDRIAELCRTAPAESKRIAMVFAGWVESSSFGFDYCDALANRLELFIQHVDFEAKTSCLMALLEMGTSHNRWFVERKFAALCGPDMDENLAKRLGVQFRISDRQVCGQIKHLESSIPFTRKELHPALIRALEAICP